MVLLGCGLLLIAFVAFQLWGTALYTNHVQGNLRQQLKTEIGHSSIPLKSWTSLPGQAGNAAIAGHRTTFAAPFYNLNELVPGDPIFVLTSQGLFRYVVRGSEIVSPDDNAVLDSSGTPELTLTTCNPRYSASTRLVVVALLDTTAAPGTKPPAQSDTKTPAKPTSKVSTSTGTGVAQHGGEGGGDGGVLPAVLWGLGTLLGAVALYFGSRRLSRPYWWLSYVVGVPLLLVALFVCFEHISLALPASF
jgi:sortase A